MTAPQVIKSMNQQDDDDIYEQKSVRQIKAMFNRPSKPPAAGQMKSLLIRCLHHKSYSLLVFLLQALVCASCYNTKT